MQIVDLQRKKICPACRHLDEGSFCGRCGAALDLPEARAGEILAMHMQAQGFRDFRKSPYAARFEALGSGFDIQLVRTDGFDRERIVDAVFIGKPPSSLKHPMHNPARVAESIAHFLKGRSEHYNAIQVWYLVPATRSNPAGHTTDTRRFGLMGKVKVSVVRYDPWRPETFPRSPLKGIFQNASRQVQGRHTANEGGGRTFGSFVLGVLSPIKDYLAILGIAISPVRLSREVRRGAIRLPEVFALGITSVLLVRIIERFHPLGETFPSLTGVELVDEVLPVLLVTAGAAMIVAPIHLVLKRLTPRAPPPRLGKAFTLYLMSIFVMLPLNAAVVALAWQTETPAVLLLSLFTYVHIVLGLSVFYSLPPWKVILAIIAIPVGILFLLFMLGLALGVIGAIGPSQFG